MLIVLLIIGVGLTMLGYKLEYEGYDSCGVGTAVLGIMIDVTIVVAMLVIGITLTTATTIPQKIEVLEEQNQKIEIQINSIAENYLAHESATYDKLTPDNAEVFAVAYPQLSSNETVQKQMSVYIENNEKITDLKLELCNKKAYEWWLYFGDGK